MPIALELFLFLLAGTFTGMLSSLFGLGGGLVVVPVSFLIFHLIGYPDGVVMHVALGTSLAVMIVTTVNSIIQHARAGNVVKSVVWPMTPFIAIGAVAGSIISMYLHSDILRYFFIVFLILIILNALFNKSFKGDFTLKDLKPFNPIIRWFVALIIGIISVLLGIGGSVMSVPYFRKHQMPIANASACAVCLTPIIAICGTIGYLYAGWHATGLPPHSFGFINLPAAVAISAGTFIGVPIGIYLLKWMSDKLAAKLYIVMLFVMLILMVA